LLATASNSTPSRPFDTINLLDELLFKDPASDEFDALWQASEKILAVIRAIHAGSAP
jgi:hypothetical protein